MLVEYSGQLEGGVAVAGTIESASMLEARTRLTQMGVQVLELVESEHPAPRRRLGIEDFRFFNDQLRSLSDAGMALEPGLQRLARDVHSPQLRTLLVELAADLSRGVPLDEAVTARRGQFPPFYAEVIAAGVRSGQLSGALYNLNTHMDLVGRTRRLIWEALGYPLVTLGFALTLLTVFFLLVLPGFREMYDDFGTRLPTLTEWMLSLGRVWMKLLAVFGVVLLVGSVGLTSLRRTKEGARLLERIGLRFPLIGAVAQASILARFSRSAALLAGAGHPMPAILRLAAGATGSPLLSSEAERCAAAVEHGSSIATATQSTRLLPAIFGYVSEVAGARGELAGALADLGRTYGDQAERRLFSMRVFLLPVVTVIVGVVLACCVLALFLPLVSLLGSLTGG